jgi:acetyl-CoA carboxylase biotin carboxyl carrier protein
MSGRFAWLGVDAVPESLSHEELEQIRDLLKIVSDNNLTELSISQKDGLAVTLSTVLETQAAAPVVSSVPATLLVAAPVRPAQPQDATVSSPTRIALGAPMVGTFFASATPSDPPFVKVGDVIAPGQVIGLIEAMKVYSEIPAEQGGRIVDAPVKSGQLVQAGQPLFFLEP